MLLGLFGTAAILFDEGRIKSLVARHIENHTGHRVEIQGALKLRLFPNVNLSAERVVLLRPDAVEGPVFFTADTLDMQVRLLPLIRGRVDATEVRLGGARINFASDQSEIEPGAGSDRHRLEGPIVIDGVFVTTGDGNEDDRETLEIDQVILSDFAFGQPLQFDFRGNIGEPGFFDVVEIDGLMVLNPAGQMRLSNLRLRGSLGDGLYKIGMLGNATFAVSPHLHVSVDGGRLTVNDKEFELDMEYLGTARPYFSANMVAKSVEMEVTDILGFLASLPYEADDSPLLTAFRGMDFDASLKAGRIGRTGMSLSDVSFLMSGVGGRVLIETMQAGIPDGYVTGKGELDLRPPEPRWRVTTQWEVANLARSLDALLLDWDLDGAGTMTLDMESASPNSDPGPLPWTGTGHIELWDGQWPKLGQLAPASSTFSTIDRFDYLRSGLSFRPSQLAFSGLQLVTGGTVIEGDVLVSIPGENLAGSMYVTGENGEFVMVQVSGTIDQPGVQQVPFGSQPSP